VPTRRHRPVRDDTERLRHNTEGLRHNTEGLRYNTEALPDDTFSDRNEISCQRNKILPTQENFPLRNTSWCLFRPPDAERSLEGGSAADIGRILTQCGSQIDQMLLLLDKNLPNVLCHREFPSASHCCTRPRYCQMVSARYLIPLAERS